MEGGEDFKMMSFGGQSTKNEEKAKRGMKGRRGAKAVNFSTERSVHYRAIRDEVGRDKGPQCCQCYNGVSSLTR